MAPIIDIHTHWLSARRFPELARAGTAIPDVLPDGTARMVNDGVSSLIYPEHVSVDVDADLSRTQVHAAARCDSS